MLWLICFLLVIADVYFLMNINYLIAEVRDLVKETEMLKKHAATTDTRLAYLEFGEKVGKDKEESHDLV